ncbi:MAG: hypothetical protein ACT4QC_07715 [Planctomycetaceae bacterium]
MKPRGPIARFLAGRSAARRLAIGKHGWAFWLGAALLALIGYPLSLGPVMWVFLHTSAFAWAGDTIGWFYAPVGWGEQYVPEPVRRTFYWYLTLWGWTPPSRDVRA